MRTTKQLRNIEFTNIELIIKEIPTVFYNSIKVLEAAIDENEMRSTLTIAAQLLFFIFSYFYKKKITQHVLISNG